MFFSISCKRGIMKKIFIFLIFVGILLFSGGVIALSGSIPETFSNSEELGEDISNFVKDIVKAKGIDEDKIGNVKKVDLNDLPSNIKLENIDSTNLALYEIDSGEGKPVYVISVSEDTYKKTLSSEDYKRSFLNFGTAEIIEEGFLNTATGVETSKKKGYVMTRDGSITAMSTNLDVVYLGEEIVEVVILLNGEIVGFGNSLISEIGVLKDHDVISYGTVEFEAGDVISVYIKSDSQIRDITTLVEITTK
jgi:hypothetical protein